jgi:hypothetical protein
MKLKLIACILSVELVLWEAGEGFEVRLLVSVSGVEFQI